MSIYATLNGWLNSWCNKSRKARIALIVDRPAVNLYCCGRQHIDRTVRAGVSQVAHENRLFPKLIEEYLGNNYCRITDYLSTCTVNWWFLLAILTLPDFHTCPKRVWKAAVVGSSAYFSNSSWILSRPAAWPFLSFLIAFLFFASLESLLICCYRE